MSTLVLKIGGNEIDDPAFVESLARAVAGLRPAPVLVHGGGKEIGVVQKALGGEPRFVEGLRVTDEKAIQAAEMVMCGAVNTRLVVALQAAGAEAQGISGVDRGLIRVEKRPHPAGDLGRVGRPVAVRGELLARLLAESVVPVIAPVSLGPEGSYNVNADEAAGAVAAALGDAEVVFVTNVPGVLVGGAVAPRLSAADVERLIGDGTITGGMIPKVGAALTALDAGVRAARITNLAGLTSMAAGGAAAGTVISGGSFGRRAPADREGPLVGTVAAGATLVSEQQVAVAPKGAEVVVRAAGEADVGEVVAIVAENARQGHLLPRSAENIRASLPSWLVAEVGGRVVGIGSLLPMGPGLVEVRSLAVLPAYRSLGVGAALVRGLVAEARSRGYARAFALTRAVGFFERLGFTVTIKERYPEKVWRDCAICPLQHACDETAVELELAG